MKKKYVFILIGIVYIFMLLCKEEVIQSSVASKILRFHVLANSDSEVDQGMKKEVRDAVGVYLQPYLKEAKNLQETRNIVNENMDGIIDVAKETLEEKGCDYDVTARITHTSFPEKSYGPYTFPAGDYEALQIVIGEGEGQNWWCVLYPNMCFRGSVFEVVEEEAEEALQEVLSPFEYASVFDSGKVQLRFKFLEFFQR